MKPPNRFLLWSFPVLALTTAILTYQMALSGAGRSSNEAMRDFEADLALGQTNMDTTLLKIEVAFKLAVLEKDREQQALIIKRRAKLYRDLKRYDRAADDLRLLLKRYAPDDQEALRDLARIEFYSGDEEAALARIEAELQRDSQWVTGLSYRAEFRYKIALRILSECDEVCAGAMDDQSAIVAAKLIRIFAGRLASDPLRATTKQKLSLLFPTGAEEEQRELYRLLNRANSLLEASYNDNSKSLERSNRVPSMASIIDILRLSELNREASEFAIANLRHLTRSNSNSYAESYFLALGAAGEYRLATRSVREFRATGLTFTDRTIRSALNVAYASKDWQLVKDLSIELSILSKNAKRRTPAARFAANKNQSLSLFYHGMALHHLKSHQGAVSLLREYRAFTGRTTPYPMALLDAEKARASSAAKLRGPNGRLAELSALKSLLAHRPKESGKLWRDLLELHRAQKSSPEEIELAAANAMAGLPSRSAEFESEWRAAGAQALRKAKLAPRKVAVSGKESLSSRKPRRKNSLELFLAIEQFAEEEEWYSVMAACDRLFALVPFFTPAVKLFLTACSNLELPDRATNLLLNRLEFLGTDDATLAQLIALRGSFTAEQDLRFIAIAPTSTVRNLMVRTLLDRGSFVEAKLVLSNVSADTRSAEDNLQLGEALLGLTQIDEALLSLRRVPPTSTHYPDAFSLLLQASLETEDPALLESTITQLAHPTTPISSDLIPIHDQLLVAGETGLASRLAEYLDSDASTRSGRNTLRLASLQMRQRDDVSALESLERAYAYLDDGSPAIGQILIAIQNQDWDDLPPLLASLDDEQSEQDAVSAMVVALLRGRNQLVRDYLQGLTPEDRSGGINLLLRVFSTTLENASEPILEEYSELIREQTRAFIYGSVNDPRDPRQALGLLLAIQHPDWIGWLVQELSDWNTSGSNMWVEYLKSEALLRLGALSKADKTIARLVTRWPDFYAGWEVANRLQLKQPVRDSELITYAKKGWNTPSHRDSTEARERIDQIEGLRESGNLQQALKVVRAALDQSPNNPPYLYQLGKIHQESGSFSTAIIAFGRFLQALAPRARDAVLPEFIEVLDLGLARKSIEADLRHQTLKGLVAAFPRNALVASKLAESDLRQNLVRAPTEAVQAAVARLTALRNRTGNLPIHELGAGGLQAWHQLLLEVDPVHCEAFIRGELLLSPTEPELWAMLAESLNTQGRYELADELLSRLLEVAFNERGLSLWIDSLIRRGKSRSSILEACTALAALKGVPMSHPKIRYLKALAKAKGNQANIPEGIKELGSLWESRGRTDIRDALENPTDFFAAVGLHFAVMSMCYGDRGEHILAQKTFALLSETSPSPSERRLYATLSYIGPHNSNAAQPNLVADLAQPKVDERVGTESIRGGKKGPMARRGSGPNSPAAKAAGKSARLGSGPRPEGKISNGLPQLFTDKHLETFRKLKTIPSANRKGGQKLKSASSGTSRKNRDGKKN